MTAFEVFGRPVFILESFQDHQLAHNILKQEFGLDDSKMSLLSFGSEEVVEVAKAKGTVDSGRFDGLPPHQRAIIEEDVNCIQDGGGSEDDDQLLDAEHSTEVKKHPTRIIIVEPVLALFFATFVSSQVLISQFALTLVAHHFNYTQSGNTSCGDTNSSNYELQQFVQGRAALLVTLVNVCVDVPGIIMVLIWGVYSDRVGRKLPMILALSGQILKFVVFIITLSLRTNLYLVLVAASIEGLLGGCPTMMMSCMAYISDTCSPVDRTIRLTIVEVSSGVCVALAQVIMGFVIANFGYVIPFYALMVCHLINILYVIFFVPEVRFPVRNRRFIQARHVMQAIRLYSHDDGNRRERWLCLVALIFCASTISGRFDPLILYGLNTPLCWTSIVVGLYVAWTSITSQAGEMALVALLTRHIGELGVSIIGCVSAIAYFVILAFCKNTVAMFLGENAY